MIDTLLLVLAYIHYTAAWRGHEAYLRMRRRG